MGAAIDLSDSRILLTGASSGIGRQLAKTLASEGAMLAIAARRIELLKELVDEIASHPAAGRPAAFKVDLSRRGAAAALADEVVAALGHIDILINNAGGGAGGSQWSVGDRDESREAMEINYWSPLALIARLVPDMRARGDGYVVNVTSGAQTVTWPGFGAYAATKAALSLATETLRLELLGSGVRVLEVVAGPLDTAVQAETRLIPGIEKMLDTGPLGTPEVMATRIVLAIKKGEHRLVYPRRTAIGYTFPRFVRAYVSRLVTSVNKEIDPQTREELMATVVRTGSFGDLKEIREEWERANVKDADRV